MELVEVERNILFLRLLSRRVMLLLYALRVGCNEKLEKLK